MVPGLRADPLAWVGPTVSIFWDDNPFWSELAQQKQEDLEKFMEKNFPRLPIAARIESTDGLKLAAFLAGLRAFIDQAAPGAVKWETLQHREVPYVKLSSVVPQQHQQDDDAMPQWSVYYTTTGGALLLSLNEDVLKSALERELARHPGTQPAAAPTTAPATQPWVGQNMALQADRRVLDVLRPVISMGYRQEMQQRCFANLAILNEWKRRFPDQDPLIVHARVWGTQLVCPGGGTFSWNDQYQTMQSSAYGHPAEPKAGPDLPPALLDYQSLNAGVTFESQGLRAKAELSKLEKTQK
jgi:hypothetical protein